MSYKADAYQVIYQIPEVGSLPNNNLEVKMRDFMSATEFGADPTGQLDSTAAFAAAGFGGRGYVIPRGSYKLGASTVVERGNKFVNRLTIPKWTTSTRTPNPEVGMVGFNTDTQTLEIHNGTGWQSVGGGVLPGTVVFMASQTTPAGYLPCDGQAVNRLAFGALFSTIGTLYGSGDGVNTFNVPEIKNRVIMGWDSGGTAVFGSRQDATVVAHTHTGTASSAGNHTHTGGRFRARVSINDIEFLGVGGGEGLSGTYETNAGGAHTHGVTVANTGIADGHPRRINLRAFIKA